MHNRTFKSAVAVAVLTGLAGTLPAISSPAQLLYVPPPSSYIGIVGPLGWERRRELVDTGFFHHVYEANRIYHDGGWFAGVDWEYHTWDLDERLLVADFAPERVIADYWLFNLETPPIGYDWVRYGPDALMVRMSDGRILEIVHHVFA
ncbi:MAG: RcnB family protein [Candidatus Saccharibacteria bacterium]|nr:RcnB family protein [Pseudorhodobacter sp.]